MLGLELRSDGLGGNHSANSASEILHFNVKWYQCFITQSINTVKHLPLFETV